jgi:His-Xaa-Ser system protein HxsD
MGEAMSALVTIEFDTSVYSLETVKRAAHWLAADYYVEIRAGESATTLELRTKSGQAVPDDLALRVKNCVLDESLRAEVRRETRGVHETLIRAALQGLVTPDPAP